MCWIPPPPPLRTVHLCVLAQASWEIPLILQGCWGRALTCTNAAESTQRWGRNNEQKNPSRDSLTNRSREAVFQEHLSLSTLCSAKARIVYRIKLLSSLCCAYSTDKASHFWPTCFSKATGGEGKIWKEAVGEGEVCLCLSELPGCVTMFCRALHYLTLLAGGCLSVERYCNG